MFHVNPKTGDAGTCRAEKGKCPFGAADEHFATSKEARRSYEMKHSNFGNFNPRQKLSKEAEGRIHDTAFNRGDHEIDYTPEEVLRKYEADIQGRTFPLSEKLNPGEPGLVLERLFGKEPDSDPGADLGTVELKTQRAASTSHPISLGNLAIQGDSRRLRSRFLGDNFQKSLKAGEWVSHEGNYYSLLVDRKQRKVRLVIANSEKQIVSANDFGWTFDSLDQKVDKKLASIAVGLYDTEETPAGDRSVTFKNLLMGGFTRESMIDKLESGQVTMEFRFKGRYAATTLAAKAENFCDDVKVKTAA
jgi:hypothetical protein